MCPVFSITILFKVYHAREGDASWGGGDVVPTGSPSPLAAAAAAAAATWSSAQGCRFCRACSDALLRHSGSGELKCKSKTTSVHETCSFMVRHKHKHKKNN